MSPEPATPTAPLQVPATPGTALVPDATANAPAVLLASALASAAGARTVCVADLSTKDYARFYLQQVYGVGTSDIRFVDSRRGLVAAVLSSVPVDRLILLLHSAGDQVTFRAGEEVVSLDELQPDLAKASGKVTRLLFDGCTLAIDPVSLYRFSEALAVAEAVAWTHTHVLGRMAHTLSPPHATSIRQEVRDLLRRAAPWIPLGEGGASESPDVLERELLTQKGFVRAYEMFFAGLTEVNFEQLLASGSFDPMRHYPRAAAQTEVCLSLARAEALEDQLGILGVPTRLIVRPTPGP